MARYSYSYLGTINWLEEIGAEDEIRLVLVSAATTYLHTSRYDDKVDAEATIGTQLAKRDLTMTDASGVPIRWIAEEIIRVLA